MTSKNLFIKLMKEDGKRRISVAALSILAFFFALPVYAAASISQQMYRIEQKITTFQESAELFSSNVTGMQNGFIVVLVFALAVLIGINGYHFLFSKTKTDLYHSIPVKRSTLFLVSYVNGILFFAVPYALMLFITLLIGRSYHLVNAATLQASLISFVVTLVCYAMIYATVILAVMLTGNVIVACMASAVFLLYGPVVRMLLSEYCEQFFFSYLNLYYDHDVIYYSPAALYVKIIIGHNSSTGILPLFVAALMTAAALTGLSLFVYSKRSSETAGTAIAFKKLCPLIKLLLIVPASLTGGLFFRQIGNTTRTEEIWLAFGLIIAIVLAHMVLEIIFEFDFKAAFRNLHHLLIGAAVTAVIVFIFQFDLLGYETYLPNEASVESVSLILSGYYSDITYMDPENEFNTLDPMQYKLENTSIKDIETCLALAQSGIENMQELRKSRYSQDFTEDENASDEEEYIYIPLCYNMNSGAKIYRTYITPVNPNKELLNTIFLSEEFKTPLFPILTLENPSSEHFVYHSPLGSYSLDGLTSEELDNLVKTYQKELLAMDFDCTQTSAPIGFISSNRSQKYYDVNVYQGYIYPSFTETIALLNDFNIPLYEYLNADNISNLSVRYFEYSEDGFADERVVDYSTPEEIEALMDYIVPAEYYYGTVANGSSIDINATYKSVPRGFANTCGFAFINNDIPENVRKDLNYYE